MIHWKFIGIGIGNVLVMHRKYNLVIIENGFKLNYSNL